MFERERFNIDSSFIQVSRFLIAFCRILLLLNFQLLFPSQVCERPWTVTWAVLSRRRHHPPIYMATKGWASPLSMSYLEPWSTFLKVNLSLQHSCANIKQSGFVSSFLGQSELLRSLGSLDLLEDYHGRCPPLGCVGGLTEAPLPVCFFIEGQHMAAETELISAAGEF